MSEQQGKIIYPKIDFGPVFKEYDHPRLFVSHEELNEAKEKAENYDWASLIYQRVIKEADFWVDRELNIPDTGGGFFHDGGSDYLITEHHYQLTVAGRNLALAFYWTKKEEYFCKVHELLMGYADKYLTYEIHDKAKRKGAEAKAGGRATPQAINEIRWALPLLWAYDLVYNELTKDERQRVEEEIFRPVAELTIPNNEGLHNHQTWYNTTVGVIGTLLKEQRYLEYAINKEDSGFLYQMANSVRPEGLWYEGSINYHFFALKALYSLAEALWHAGINIYQVEGYRKMLDFPLEFMTPGLTCTSINDGRQLSMPISTHDGQAIYEIAYRRTGEESYGVMVSKAPRVLLEALIYGVPELPTGDLPTGSKFWPGSGLATLRAGTGRDYKQITFDFLPYAGGHSHPAKLGLEIYGLGRILAPDPGAILYRDPAHTGWYKQTISHNCLVVNGKSQLPTGLQPIQRCGEGPVLNFVQVRDDTIYPGFSLWRMTGVTADYIIDLYHVVAQEGEDHYFDWVYHNYGRFACDVPLAEVENKENGDGYHWITDLRKGETDEIIRSTWYLPEGLVHLTTLPGSEVTEIIAGNGMAAELADLIQVMRTDPHPVPMVIYRRRGSTATFRSLIQPMPFDGKQWMLAEPEEALPSEVIGMKLNQGRRKVYFFIGNAGQTIYVRQPSFTASGKMILVEFEGESLQKVLIDGEGEVVGKNWAVQITGGQLQMARSQTEWEITLSAATEFRSTGLGLYLLKGDTQLAVGSELCLFLEAGKEYRMK